MPPDPFDGVLGAERPPCPPDDFRVFAPDGTVVEFRGWVLVDRCPQITLKAVFAEERWGPGAGRRLSPKVVILNLTAGKVVYTPRTEMGTLIYLGKGVREWLERNPQWPRVLELDDQNVYEEVEEGLFLED
jgi:hypothetical protein